jgi:hypothetical protein
VLGAGVFTRIRFAERKQVPDLPTRNVSHPGDLPRPHQDRAAFTPRNSYPRKFGHVSTIAA